MDKLDLIPFGKQLLETNDLDPVYVLLWEAQLEPEHLKKWLLAYWAFYHVGTASHIADAKDYWKEFENGVRSVGNTTHPRSTERRHFRGQAAVKSLYFLQGEDIDGLFGDFDRAAYENRTLSVKDVMEYVQEWVGFGPWISFKVADMLERLKLVRVSFNNATMFLFDSPREGAKLAWDMYAIPTKKEYSDSHKQEWAVEIILESELGDSEAPPRHERNINVQEVETILCKWKSHMGGHYHIGEDIASCRSGLLRFAKSKTSQRLIAAGKKGKLW